MWTNNNGKDGLSDIRPTAAEGSMIELDPSEIESSGGLGTLAMVFVEDLEGISAETMDFGPDSLKHEKAAQSELEIAYHGKRSLELPHPETVATESTELRSSSVELQFTESSASRPKEIESEPSQSTTPEQKDLGLDAPGTNSIKQQDSDPDESGLEETNPNGSRSVTPESQESAEGRSPASMVNEPGEPSPASIGLVAEHAETTDPIYKALNKNTRSLRLLSFQAPDGIVSAKLEHFEDVKTCPPFIALSYTWGDEWPKQSIELNGWRFPVRQNLYDFMDNLRHARYAWAKKVYGDDASTAVTKNNFPENPILWEYWWIDAICIDQWSIEEKNHQVRIMNDIYSQAKFVFVWLGNDLEVEIEKERAAQLVDFGWIPNLHEAHIALRREWLDAASMVDALTCTPEVTHVLLKNPYWTRLWIVQEFVLARDLLLCAGNFVIRWKDFRDSITNLGRDFQVENTYMDHLMDQRYHREQGELQERLSSLIQKFYTTHCADPRDRVFGLLGLSKTRLRADYSRSAQEVFIGVLNAELETISGDEEFDDLHLFCLQELASALEIKPHRAEELFSSYGMSPPRRINHEITRLARRMRLLELERS